MFDDEEKKETDQVEEAIESEGAPAEQEGEEVESPPEQLPPPPVEAISPSKEHNWAMISHLSILLNLFTGFLGPILALIIYLVYKDRSRYIAYQSLQSTIFQLIVWVGVWLAIGAIWLLNIALTFIVVGLLCWPFTILATIFLLAVLLASLVYGVYAAIKSSHGEDFRYWLVGDWVRGTYEKA
jgi:uncharacterized Tic20 family protein